MTALRIATCATMPEPDTDATVLAGALATAGFDARWLAWDDPNADWDAPIPTVIRSTWNYAHDVAGFAAWVDRTAAAAPLWNSPAIVHANLRKRYLLELEARGVPIVPTTLVPRGGQLAQPIRERVVIKPEIGAGSLHARAFEPGDPEAHVHLAQLTARGAALVQPYMESVDDYGERSIIFIDGELTHAIRKTPRFAGGVERTTGPYPIADAERDVARAALAPVADGLLYGRVDLARDPSGQPRVMELELVEPSLFFHACPYALDRFVAALGRLTTSVA